MLQGSADLRVLRCRAAGYHPGPHRPSDSGLDVSGRDHRRGPEPVRLTAELSLDGHPFETPVQVSAVLTSPEDSVANLLSVTPEPSVPAGATFDARRGGTEDPDRTEE